MSDRIKFTELEKQAMKNHPDALTIMNMGQDINEAIEQEKVRKFNADYDKFSEEMEARNKEVEETKESLPYDVNKAEIKPMYSRILVKPFKQNPFQRMKIENGLIIDSGGYTPHTQLNPLTGKYEEQKEYIVTGVVVEVGPECKYLTEGDVVYYRIDTVVPVPFFKSGIVSLAENQVIACVNENLNSRWKNGK